ncbi:hypothetical protein [Sphingosinicella sp.]|uniref:hypothetical protein n=1 Tax=Sphingosinicella sp. TaxID=1917971 RepID=UPI0040379C40
MADKETIVTTDGGGSGAGMIVALIALVVVLLGAFFLYQQGVFSGGTRDVNADIKIETPPAKTN